MHCAPCVALHSYGTLPNGRTACQTWAAKVHVCGSPGEEYPCQAAIDQSVSPNASAASPVAGREEFFLVMA
eukprot:10943767-Karenia_brevis.AAC.1